ncbi:hypothetical protein SASPL_127850 [Salvia splendens]|uniref:HTH La-type RNA-binding domain-containing protein n=1 Tax=Salvia splendens TaxID=180675 RepID=A0A8X8XAD5_SALSN|nr:hypothetical protein SASPL_127850 [Salvia splendens]
MGCLQPSSPLVPSSSSSEVREAQELRNNILKQIEYYFSDDNLARDVYIKQYMGDKGWVPISLIASFPRGKKVRRRTTSKMIHQNCNREGVWEKRYERCLICSFCNSRICHRKLSRTAENPNRWFYTCPHVCPLHSFFISFSNSSPISFLFFRTRSLTSGKTKLNPMNGSSCLTAAAAAPDFAGSRDFFPDPLRVGSCSSAESRSLEGEGSCGYRVWQDELQAMEAREAEEKKKREAEAVEAMINNQNQFNVLREHIASTKDRLFQIEAEVSCCEVEMRLLKLQLEKLSKNKEVLEGKHLIASNELEQSQKLLEEKEAEQNAAFDRARALLEDRIVPAYV